MWSIPKETVINTFLQIYIRIYRKEMYISAINIPVEAVTGAEMNDLTYSSQSCVDLYQN